MSSSAHLRIVSAVGFGGDPGAAFTAVSQLGTEAAVIVYFAKDIWHLFLTWVRGFRDAEVRATDDYRLAWLVIIGSVPIAVLGVLLKDQIEGVARNLWLVATTLIVFGVLLGLAERHLADLGVENRVRRLAGQVEDDFDILAAGMKDLQHLLIVDQQVEQRFQVDARRHRVDRRGMFAVGDLDLAVPEAYHKNEERCTDLLHAIAAIPFTLIISFEDT